MNKAISIVIYDPSGNQKAGETYPPNSVWMGSTDWMTEPMRKSVLKQRREMNEPMSTEPGPVEQPKLCALGSKCLRAYKRRGAVVQGAGLYCSDVCRGAARAAKTRNTVAIAASPDLMALDPA